MKRLLWIVPALLLGGCVAVPYDPYPYAYQSPVYAAPAPVYVAPSAGVYYGYGRGYYGGRWRRW